MYLSVVLKDGKRERVHAPGFESVSEAVAAFVDRKGIYEGDWLRLDVRGEPRYVRYDQVAHVRPVDGPSQIAA